MSRQSGSIEATTLGHIPPSPWIVRLIGTFFFSGRSPVMPGTCGTLAALLVLVLLPASIHAIAAALLAIVATLSGPALARSFMRSATLEDPQDFVWDEVAGLAIAAWRPERPDAWGFALAFVLFRIFDMTKPWPVGRLERLPRGYGVVYDDVAAGLIALGLGVLIEALLF